MPQAKLLSLTTLTLACLAPTLGHAQSEQASCTLSGVASMPVNLAIYDKADGGSPIARFTGGDTALAVSDPFTQGGKRAQVRTGTGSGSFRIAGWTDASQVPVYTAVNVPIVSGSLWIAPHQLVEITASSGSRFKVKKRLTTPISQTFNTWAECSALTLSTGTTPGYDVPGNARGYVLRKDSAELYDGWQKDKTLVTVLAKAPEALGVLLWSEEQRGGFVRVTYRGEIGIDAWARASDLRALPRGETMDVQRPSVVKRSPPQLKLADNPRVAKTSKELVLRTAARDDGPSIGVVEANTELYVLDVVAGWANVLPKSLHVAPHGDGQFWVKNADL